jgi:hypothetical protein
LSCLTCSRFAPLWLMTRTTTSCWPSSARNMRQLLLQLTRRPAGNECTHNRCAVTLFVQQVRSYSFRAAGAQLLFWYSRCAVTLL